MKNFDEETLAYAAGFLDGEGCFSVDGGKYHKIRVSCANTNRPAIEWLHKNFGGSFCRNATRIKKKNHRRCFSWSVVANDAKQLCCILAPYLKEKAEQALLLIAIQQTKGTARISEELFEERTRLANKVKELKHVSWN